MKTQVWQHVQLETRHSLIHCFENTKCFNLINMNWAIPNRTVHVVPLSPVIFNSRKMHLPKVVHCNIIYKNAKKRAERVCWTSCWKKTEENIFAKRNTVRMTQKLAKLITSRVTWKRVERIQGEVYPWMFFNI